jgi:hypothetical protein
VRPPGFPIGPGSLLPATMTSADFLAHRKRIYSRTSPGKNILFPSITAESTPIRLLAKDFVLLCTLIHVREPHIPSCRTSWLFALSCSALSVPNFVVSLSSLLSLQKTSLRLTNRLYQLACKGLAPSRVIGTFVPMFIPGTHIGLAIVGLTEVIEHLEFY